MMFGSKPASRWRDTAPSPGPPGPPWRSAAPRVPYRMRWWKLAGVAVVGLVILAAATWAVFWIRPPDPAHLVCLVAGYDNTLAVPPNPYNKTSARELADLAKPGGWLGTQSRVRGSSKPVRFTRIGLPDLSTIREKCIVIVIAAHGGRDREGAFLFPEDSTAELEVRVRVKTILDQLAKLPPSKQKLLILDATEPPAYTDLGLVHNDFASAVEELNSDIAKIPNLAVFMSTGDDQRSWTSPESGQSAFLYHVLNGLRGAADANGDKRITGGELVDYVSPRVRDWARDHRGALQTPILLPEGDEGKHRVEAMHLAMTEGPPAEDAAPTPFMPPPGLEQAWEEYRELASAYPPPTAYTPHLWRQYQAWVFRFEQAIIAGDSDGEKNAQSKVTDVKRQIVAARRLVIGPQTLAIQSGLGGLGMPRTVPDFFQSEIKKLIALPAVEWPTAWAKVQNVPGLDPDASRLLWCRALIEWVSDDPVTRLPLMPSLVPLMSDYMSVRPAEINFLLMLARHLPPKDKAEMIGPLLKRVLRLRLDAENAAEFTGTGAYPFPEWLGMTANSYLRAGDLARRNAEDLCFADTAQYWQDANRYLKTAEDHYTARTDSTKLIHEMIGPWHRGVAGMPGLTEWLARGSSNTALERLSRELQFQARRSIWTNLHDIAAAMPALTTNANPNDLSSARKASTYASGGMDSLNDLLAGQMAELLATKPEFDARQTPRAAVVSWWQSASLVLTAPIPDIVTPAKQAELVRVYHWDSVELIDSKIWPAKRAELVREFRRVSRQLIVTGRTRPEALPVVTPETTREQAFSAARRRGLLLLDRLRVVSDPFQQPQPAPGFPQQLASSNEKAETPEYRFDHFAFQADARQSLAEASSSCGERLRRAIGSAGKTDDLVVTERWLRIVPAYAPVSDSPLDRLRRDRVKILLAEQARRTYLDHWYGESGTRYYQNAIQHLAADAQKVDANSSPDLFKPFLGVEPLFPADPRTPVRVVITDEPKPELSVNFRRQPPKDVEGFPMFWVTPPLKSESRLPITLDSNVDVPNLVRPISRPTTPLPRFPEKEQAPLQIVGFFRGRILEKPVPVDIYRVPDQISATAPALNTTAIAVRADPRIRKKYGFGVGAVSIVLDCSGSMGPTDRKDPSNKGLYSEALRALDELLRDLPPGTKLNVWVFGQRMPEAKTPEDTIREVLPPTILPYDASEIIKQIHADVDHLEPWNMSPIVRAALLARDRIKDEPFPFKAVVLLSDGVDTHYDADQKNLQKRSVKDALRAEFPPSRVSLAILALPVPAEETGFQDDFKVINDFKPSGKFVPTEFDRPGHVKDLPERVRELTAWLRNGLNPRVRYSLEPLDGQPKGGDLSASTETSDNWYSGRLEPGTYRFSIRGAAADIAPAIDLKKGDRLLLDLTEYNKEAFLRRHWYADTVAGEKTGNPSDDWRLALLQNRSEAGGLRLFATIEDRPKAVEPISVSRIGDVWFDLKPVIPKPGPLSVRWQIARGYPAPCWSLDVPAWPAFPGGMGGASPKLEAWWSPGGPFPASGMWTIPKGKPISSLKGESKTFGDSPLTITSIGPEFHAVDGKPEPQSCLVVRLTYPHEKPAWVRPIGTLPAGSEIRFYREADSVRCLFWGLDPTKITGFDVVLLKDALKQAKELGYNAVLNELPAPSDTSPRPEPPVEVK